MSPILTTLDKGWPFAASVLAGCMAFGSLHSDVTDLKQAQTIAHQDHDSIVRMEQGQKDVQTDLADIKKSLERIERR